MSAPSHLRPLPSPDDAQPPPGDDEPFDARLLPVYRLLRDIGRRARARGAQRQREDGDRA